MSATVEQATDEVFGLFREHWLANAAVLNDGEAPEIIWQGTSPKVVPNPPYVVASIVDTGRPFQSLSDANSFQRFQRFAFVAIQVRVPLGDGDSFGIQLATVARNAFEKRSTDLGVFFFNCQITRHTEPTGSPYAQFTVTADFSFGEIR